VVVECSARVIRAAAAERVIVPTRITTTGHSGSLGAVTGDSAGPNCGRPA